MFSVDGKYIIKENFEEDIKKINKNSNLFYDAEGALRAAIMISEYGDFTISTNYGAVKQELSFNSDGTLRTSGSRICLEDVCITKDDIIKLKEAQLNGQKGDTGDQGVKGDTGSQGVIGVTGATGVQGAQGIKGNTGAQGAQGIQGIKGDNGTTGAQGIKGDTGAQGIKGDTGAQGIKGDTGAQGDTGSI